MPLARAETAWSIPWKASLPFSSFVDSIPRSLLGVRRVSSLSRSGPTAILAGMFLVFPGICLAGEVLIPKNAAPAPDTPAVFRASNGEVNNLTITRFGYQFRFFDSLALLTAGRGCTLASDGSATCEPESQVIEAYLKDADDTARVSISGIARVWAGSGNDTVSADSLTQFSIVYGEGGDDNIKAGGEGGQLADGGPGNDIVNAGGFVGNATGLGGSGDDIVYYRTQVGGAATLGGGNGDDTIIWEPAGGTAAGDDGDDIIVVHGRVPSFVVSGFTISGGVGADTIIGGLFSDTIDGGADRDYIDVLDGGADTVSCGSGTDVVRFDATDTVAADCEILLGSTP